MTNSGWQGLTGRQGMNSGADREGIAGCTGNLCKGWQGYTWSDRVRQGTFIRPGVFRARSYILAFKFKNKILYTFLSLFLYQTLNQFGTQNCPTMSVCKIRNCTSANFYPHVFFAYLIFKKFAAFQYWLKML